MAVLLDTSLGEIVIDLHSDLCPLTCKNFLKLCKIKYYNNCIFHDVKKDFIAQTGDPTGTGSGGDSLYKHLYGEQARFFADEIHPKLSHEKIGTVAMASAGENLNASQFYITLRAGLDYLDGKHTVFGEVAEGLETLMRISEAYVDEKGRPYKNIRIKHVSILDDPFDDPPALADMIPDKSPELKPPAEGEEVRLEDDWVPMDELMDPEELDKSLRKKEAHSRAVVLEMIGDIPDADIAPPENVLFICKLNPVTQEDDLNTLFSRFGKIISADIIRDYKTGDSLCYGFIEFETKEACEAAYFKMDNVLIDDRRIHVDFSQSVSKLWTRFRKFGARDTNEHGPDAASQRGKSACFNCGEFGHLKKDCPNEPNVAKGAAINGKPRYTLKEPAGQRGDPQNRYEMVFDETSDASGSDKPEGRSNSRGYHPKNERPFKRPSKDDDNEKRARQRLSPRERNVDRSYQSARDIRLRDRDETREDERSRGRDDHDERRARLPPPPPSSRGRFEDRGHPFRKEDRNRERGESRRDEKGVPRRDERGAIRKDERGELKRDESGDPRRDERGNTRRDGRGDSRRDDRVDLRKDHRGDSRRDDRGDPRREERGDPRKDDKDDPRRDEKGDPRKDDKGDPRRDERGHPRKDDKRDPRRDERGDPRKDDKGDPRRDDRGDSRKDYRGDVRRDERGDPVRDDRGDPRRDERGDPRRENRVDLRGDERMKEKEDDPNDRRTRPPLSRERPDDRRYLSGREEWSREKEDDRLPVPRERNENRKYPLPREEKSREKEDDNGKRLPVPRERSDDRRYSSARDEKSREKDDDTEKKMNSSRTEERRYSSIRDDRPREKYEDSERRVPLSREKREDRSYVPGREEKLREKR